MMKASNRLIPTLMAGALMLQGCAETGATRASSTVVSVPVQTTADASPESASEAAAIPENDGKPVVKADTKANFEAVAQAVRQQMQPGGRFAFVDKAGREMVTTRLADMQALFNQYGVVNRMDPRATERLLADQNAINEVLARYDGNRRICWQETPVGTHFPRTVCQTLAEIQAQRVNSKQSMDQAQNLLNQRNQINNAPVNGIKTGH